MKYENKITGSIKVYKKEAYGKKPYFITLLASNEDFKTKEKLRLYSVVIFRQKEYGDMINDGDIIEIIGKLKLSKSTYQGRALDITLFVENVLGINGNIDQEGYSNENEEEIEEIMEADELPF